MARAEDERVMSPQQSVMEEEGKDVPPVILAMEDEYEAMAAAPGSAAMGAMPAVSHLLTGAEGFVEGATLPAGKIV